MIGLLLADELSELKKNKGIPETDSKISNEKLQGIDDELANLIKNLNDKVKTLANEIKML